MDYLQWAKLHPRVRFELTESRLPTAELDEIAGGSARLSLEVRGSYGDPDLIDSLSARYRCPPGGVVPVPGTSCANFIALATAVGHGASVAVEHPVYEPIAGVASFLGLNVIPLHRRPERGFTLDASEIDPVLAQGVSAVMLTNLHNPSGARLNRQELSEIATRCEAAKAMLVVDEVYLDGHHLISGTPLWTAASVGSNVIACSSLTKIYGLGGLRVGWLMADGQQAERARRIMDLLSVDNSAPAASLAVWALARMTRIEARYRCLYEEGQSVYRRWLGDEPLVTGYASCGALFECVKLPHPITGDQLNDLLVTEYDTQVVPGRFFGLPDHIRLGIALPQCELSQALILVSEALRRLVKRAN